MDVQTALNMIFGAVATVVMPAITMLLNRIKEAAEIANKAKSDLQDYRTYVAENFTSLRRFEGFETALFKKLDAIEDKLDGKADKP